MAVGDDMSDDSVSSFILKSLENGGEDVLSPEDIAWADSCLIKDAEILESDWDSLRGALLEILSSQPKSLDSTASGSDSFPGVTDMEMLPYSEEAETAQVPGRTDDDLVLPSNEEVETNNGNFPINNEPSMLLSQIFQGNLSQTFQRDAFLPNYKDSQKVREAIDSGLNSGFSADEMEASTEDNIFRVWDLDIPAEEDELVKQLNKALTETSLTVDHSWAWKDSKDGALDNLIAGIADMSLNQNFT